MVRVVAVRPLESCLDSVAAREVTLDGPLDEATMRHLACEAGLQYFPHFPRPYFRIDKPRRWVLQGILGDTTFRATFSPDAGQTAEAELVALVAQRGEPPSGTD
jgi:hypothetical protein